MRASRRGAANALDGALIDRREAANLADFFKVLGSEVRLRTVHALALNGELYTDQLADILGVDVPDLRADVTRLVEAGIVSRRRVGRRSAYRLAHPGLVSFLSGALPAARIVSRPGRARARVEPMVQRWLDLAPRQREILGLLAEGRSAEDIAGRLGITEATARTHIHHILSGLGVRSQLAAVAAARRHGLVF